jgi:hypothetical protein
MSTSAVQAQMSIPSIKGAVLAAGTVITLTGSARPTGKYKRGADGPEITSHAFTAVTSEGKVISIPVAELTRMITVSGSSLVDITGEKTNFPPKFKISSSSDRVNSNGVVYPANCYKNFEVYNKETINNEKNDNYRDYAFLVKDGIKADNKAPAVQDYTVIID